MNHCPLRGGLLAAAFLSVVLSMTSIPTWAQTRPSLASLQAQVDKLLKGVAPPCSNGGRTIHFADCGNGTVTDIGTGMVWLKLATCGFDQTHDAAVRTAATLRDGQCGLSDNSLPGDWRLPTKAEMQGLFASIAKDCAYTQRDCVSNPDSTYYRSMWFPFVARWSDGSDLPIQRQWYWVRESAELPCCGEAGNIRSGFAVTELSGGGQFSWLVRAR